MPAATEWLFVIAAVLHIFAVPDHAAVWVGYAAFFVVVAAAQGVYSVLLPRLGHRLGFVVVGIVSTAALLAVWLDSRLYHAPVGPHRLHGEPFGVLDVTCAIVEIAAVVLLARSVPGISRRRFTRTKELTWT